MSRKRGNGEGTIHRRKGGGWCAQYTVYTAEGRKRKTLYGKTRAEVGGKLAKALSDREGGLTFDAGSLVLADYLYRWLEDSVRDSVKQHTFENYAYVVRLHLAPTLGHLKLKALSPAHVQGLYRSKLNSGLSRRTVQYIHTTLHKALKQAVMDGLIPRNVTEAVKAPQALKKEIKPLNPTQIKALLSAACGDRLEALYVFAIHTGLRRSEILGLKWTDVDLEAGVLSVQRSLDTNGTFNPPKRNKSRRTVKLTDQAIEALKSHRARQNEERLRLGSLWEDHGLVFPNRVGKPMNRDNLYHREFKPLLKKAGLSGFTFHSLRHTCACATRARLCFAPKTSTRKLSRK